MSEEQKYYTCNKGLLVTKDEDGNYLPFFINTRSKDITYSNSNFDDNFLKDLIDMGCTEIEKYYPTPTYFFDYLGWHIELNHEKNIIATKELKLDNFGDIFTLKNTIDGIYYEENILRFQRQFFDANINFPFRMKRHGISISTVLNAMEDDMKSSWLHVRMDENGDDADVIENMTLSLVINDVPDQTPSTDIMEYDEKTKSIKFYSKYVDYYNEGIVINSDIDVVEKPEENGDVGLYFANTTKEAMLASSSIFIRLEGEIFGKNIFTDAQVPEKITLKKQEEEVPTEDAVTGSDDKLNLASFDVSDAEDRINLDSAVTALNYENENGEQAITIEFLNE